MFKIGKSQIVMTSFFAVAFLGTLPAMAELGTVWTDFQYYASDLRNYLSNNISESFNPVELQAQSALTSSSEDLKIPNPNAAARSTREQIVLYSVSDKFENNPALYGTTVSGEINRYITRGAVEGVFGREGQSRLKGKLEDTQKIVERVNELTQEAEKEKNSVLGNQCVNTGPSGGTDSACQVTKSLLNLLSQNFRLQADQSKIMGENLGNTIQLRNDIQYSNLNLADISQQMNEVNRARRVGTSAEVARLLRVTSQADLFRKSSNSPSLENNPSSLENNPLSPESNSPSPESNPPSSENNPPSLENIPSPLTVP